MSDGLKRREFLKVLGVSGAGAGMVGCSTESVERLIPYVVPPEEITPGVATWYTSVCGECEAGCGIWVRTREGRVVKVEGNPDHPVSGGALCSRGHSSIQGLYNPDRFTGPMARQNGQLQPISWDEAEQMLADRLGSAGPHLMLTGSVGPSLMTLFQEFAGATGGRVIRYDTLAEAPLREAGRIAFGTNVVPWYDIDEARFLVSFGADFLESWLSPVRDARGFARMSGVDEQGVKGRFVFVGSRLSLTGQNADEWLPIQPGSEALVALAMANVISGAGAGAGPYRDIVNAYTPENVADATGISAESIRELAVRFAEEGPSLALGPGVAGQHRNATAANLAVTVLNSVAGNVGRTVHYNSPQLNAPAFGYRVVQRAVQQIGQGAVGTLLVHGSNPVYSLPASSGFRQAFESVPFKVSFASSPDETAALADLILPDRHFLESWGDSSVRPGLSALRQPAMQPVPHFDSKQTGDVLLSVAARMGQDLGWATFYDRLRTRWQGQAALAGVTDCEAFWHEALKSGVAETGSVGGSSQTLRQLDRALVFDPPDFDGRGDLHLMVYPSSRFGDGALNSNRPWLHELPDPVSKITWHSWVEMHPSRAESMDLRNGDMVILSTDNGSVELPVWIYPGIRENVVAVPMGGGHDGAGRFADGNGVNPLDLLPAEAEALSGGLVHFATKVTVTPTGERRKLASIAGSDSQSNRPIAPAVALTALSGEGEQAEEDDAHGPLKELQGVGGFVPVETEGRPQDFPLEGAQHGEYGELEEPRWAMTIDLDKCTGCSACVTACQSENNVAWVGENQVTMGRDMGWIRLERYYEAVDASHAGPLDVRFLPMICQHCGNAPCEPVCPVFATYHTPDGINTQVYNRCVGTRYCLNNCPYKVRVFNWYTYTDEEPVREGLGHAPEPLNWGFNPDVTVRENGVMEKCSFCIHRIRGAQDRAAVEGSTLQDGDIIPACQQSCPAEAIVFGNIRDPRSRVAQSAQNARVYRVLDEMINTQPAVSYLKKVTFHDVESGEH